MNEVDRKQLPPVFYEKGGKMGGLIKEKNWAKTSFGIIESWPQNLTEFTGMIMLSKHPMMIYWGPEFLCLFNDAFADTFLVGIPLSEKLGMPAPEVIGDIWPDIHERLAGMYTKNVSGLAENVLLQAHANTGNQMLHCNINKNLIYHTDATPAGILAIYTISNMGQILTQAEKKVQQNEEKLELVLEASGIGTWEWPIGSEYIVASPRFLEIFGFSVDKKLRRSDFAPLFHPDDLRIREQALLDAGKHGNFNYQARIINGSNEIKWIEIVGKTLKEEESGLQRAIGTVRDITLEKENQLLLEHNEKKFRDITDTSPVLIWMTGLDLKIQFVNDAWLDFSGTENSGYLGKIWLDYFHPEDTNELLLLIEAAKNKSEDFTVESRMKSKDGNYRWMQITGRPRHTAERKIDGFIGACMDIHDRILIEQKLKDTEYNYRFLADTLPHFIWTTDPAGVPQYYNQAFYEFTGLNLQKIQNEGWQEIVHPDDRDENMERWTKSLKTGQLFEMEHRFRQLDGSYRWQLTRSIPQHDNDGNIKMWIGTSMDIAYIKKHEQEKNDFIKMANHELKTPVTTIKGYVQMMKRTHGNSEDALLNQSLSSIEKQINKLTNLIGNLLDVTRIESGHIPLSKEPFILAVLVEDTIEDIQAAMPSHQLVIAEESYATVFADKERISQVLVNLFTNAIKYSPMSNKVEISIIERSGEVIVKVEDFGIGILENDQPHIFDRFYRVEGKDEKTYPGFGIGLFIVKEIIQLHNGRLWVQSEKDKGSQFYFSLPKKEYIEKK